MSFKKFDQTTYPKCIDCFVKKFSVWRQATPAEKTITYKYIGCYVDNHDRDLKKHYGDNNHTPQTCSILAAAGGYKYFALQAKVACWAGNTYNTILANGKTYDAEC